VTTRKNFRCVFELGGAVLSTGIQINVPDGLTRRQAVDYVTGVVAKEVSRYAAWEALGLGPTDNDTDWNEKVT
jgi:predicted SprT family Zn-dependent metalloprotease